MNRRVLLLVSMLPLPGRAQQARQIVEEAQRRARSSSQRYEGTLDVIGRASRVARKSWRYERLGSFGEARSLLRFTAPPEVKGVALLVHNHQDRSSDQWMWTPALQRERRIALQDRSTRFFGTDFSFEDLEERDAAQFDYQLTAQETLDGQACWRLESRPRRSKVSQYTHSQLWVRQDIWTFVRVDAFKQTQLVRRITYSGFENVHNIWTARRLEVEDVARKSRTLLTLDKLEYNIPLDEREFTLQALRRAS